jgi:hypothetical protein
MLVGEMEMKVNKGFIRNVHNDNSVRDYGAKANIKLAPT